MMIWLKALLSHILNYFTPMQVYVVQIKCFLNDLQNVLHLVMVLPFDQVCKNIIDSKIASHIENSDFRHMVFLV